METSFGDTNIILTGEKNNPPLVVLHGSNGCAPVALEALLGLVDNFRIYAIDVLGQPNLSAAFRPEMKDDSYGKWMFEILTRLNIWDAILVGISFGGFISWKTLVFDARRISKAFLIAPAGIVNGNYWKALWKIFLPIKRYKWGMNIKYVHQFLNELFTEKDDFSIPFFSTLLMDYEMDFSSTPLIQKEAAKKITTPVYLVAAEKDLFFSGKKLVQRSKIIFPSLQEILWLENSKHVPSSKDYERIVTFIKNNSSR
ncbi:MAG: alpha/beta fold hydrolase [Saprospiraceae bacterium]